MPRPVWPPSFPRIPLAAGYAEGVANNIRRTQPSAGPAKVRLKAGTAPDVTTATLLFSGYAQYRDFWSWFNDRKNGLAKGAKCFDYTHPLSGETLTIRLAAASDDNFYAAAPFQGTTHWAVSLTMEVMP